MLHEVVRENLETFLGNAREQGAPVALFVERELRAYLDCGILARGFLRLHCDACGHDRLVAFSCRGRGFCPSCGGRRMADTAAHLVDCVLPEVPVRQWVLTLPYPLRYRCAWDARLTSEVLRAFLRALFADLRRRARHHHGVRAGHCGAVTAIQRFGSSLNLAPHAFIDADAGRFSRATERIEEALDPKGEAIPLGIESALISLRCLIEMYRGDWSGCQQSAALLAPRARRIGSTYMQSLSLTGSGCALFFQGDREQGIALMREGVEVLERSEIMMNGSTSYACLAEALALAGRYDEAEKQAELALERARQADRLGEAQAQAQRALFLVTAGRSPRDDAQVDAALARAVAVACDKGSTREVAIARLRAVEALKEVRDVGWQQELLDECAQSFAAMQMPWYSLQAETLKRAEAAEPGETTNVPE